MIVRSKGAVAAGILIVLLIGLDAAAAARPGSAVTAAMGTTPDGEVSRVPQTLPDEGDGQWWIVKRVGGTREVWDGPYGLQALCREALADTQTQYRRWSFECLGQEVR